MAAAAWARRAPAAVSSADPSRALAAPSSSSVACSFTLRDGFIAIELDALVSQARSPRLELDPLQLLLTRPYGQLALGFPPALQLGACLRQAFPGLRAARVVPRHGLPSRSVAPGPLFAPRLGLADGIAQSGRIASGSALPISSSWASKAAAALASSLCSASMAARS